MPELTMPTDRKAHLMIISSDGDNREIIRGNYATIVIHRFLGAETLVFDWKDKDGTFTQEGINIKATIIPKRRPNTVAASPIQPRTLAFGLN